MTKSIFIFANFFPKVSLKNELLFACVGFTKLTPKIETPGSRQTAPIIKDFVHTKFSRSQNVQLKRFLATNKHLGSLGDENKIISQTFLLYCLRRVVTIIC